MIIDIKPLDVTTVRPIVLVCLAVIVQGRAALVDLGFRGQQISSAVGEFTDVDAMLAEAAPGGVEHLLLSPWINLIPVDAPPGEARTVCQVQNDALASITAARPGQVSAVGAVPLQDPGRAAQLITELVTIPGLCGAEIPSSVAGRYLGDDYFLPFWEAAEAAGALVFIHPSTRGFGLPALGGYYLWNSVGNPLETAVTAAHIAVAGVLERYPRLRILLAHGGGALPVVRGRLRQAFAVRAEARARAEAGPDQSLRTSCSARTVPSTWARTIRSRRCGRCGSAPVRNWSSAATRPGCWEWPVAEPI